MDWDLKENRRHPCALPLVILYFIFQNQFFLQCGFLSPWKHHHGIFLGTFLSNLVLNVEGPGEEKSLNPGISGVGKELPD